MAGYGDSSCRVKFRFCRSGRNSGKSIGVVLMFISMVSYISSIFWVKQINAPLAPMSQATGSLLVSALASLLLVPFIYEHIPTAIPGTKTIIGFYLP